MFEIWLTFRLLKEGPSKLFNQVSWLALIGMSIGVASLIVVMAVISGFQTTLENAVVDISGHLLVIKRGEPIDNMDILLPKLQKIAPQIISASPFVHVEGMIAHKGKVSGIVVQGLDPLKSDQTLNLRPRIIEGVYNLGKGDEENPPVMIGKGLKEKMNIRVGDIINIVLPKNSPTARETGFVPQLKKFRVVGVVDLGMYEFDSRFIVTSSLAAQKLAGIGPFFTGLRLKLKDGKQAHDVSLSLSSELGMSYLVRDWMESHHNLFEAIKLEKIAIFVVLLFITLAACFNVSSTLFISVIRRYHDIATLKAMGETPRRLRRFFTLQGTLLGIIGCAFGLFLGLGVCILISKTNIIYVPAEIYHISRLPIDIRWRDVGLTMFVSLVLCYVSTLVPAWKGSKMNPVEGLRYD